MDVYHGWGCGVESCKIVIQSQYASEDFYLGLISDVGFYLGSISDVTSMDEMI